MSYPFFQSSQGTVKGFVYWIKCPDIFVSGQPETEYEQDLITELRNLFQMFLPESLLSKAIKYYVENHS